MCQNCFLKKDKSYIVNNNQVPTSSELTKKNKILVFYNYIQPILK